MAERRHRGISEVADALRAEGYDLHDASDAERLLLAVTDQGDDDPAAEEALEHIQSIVAQYGCVAGWTGNSGDSTSDVYVEAEDIAAAAAVLGRKGGKARSERKTAAVRQNAQRGGRPRCLGTILLDTPDGKTRGRILWQKSSGQIRVARPGQTWDTAEDAAMAPEATIEEAGFAVMAAWRLPCWDLKMRGTE